MQIGFCGLLAILFITLKLCGVVAWSWLWVLSPIWLPIVIALVFSGLMILSVTRRRF